MQTFHVCFWNCWTFLLPLHKVKNENNIIKGISSLFWHQTLDLIYWAFCIRMILDFGYIWHMSVTICENIFQLITPFSIFKRLILSSFSIGTSTKYKTNDWYTFQNVNHKININSRRMAHILLSSRSIYNAKVSITSGEL